LSDQSKKNEMGGACGMYQGQERCKTVLVGTPEGKSPLGRWEDNSKMDLDEVRWMAWTGLIWLKKEAGGRLLSMQ